MSVKERCSFNPQGGGKEGTVYLTAASWEGGQENMDRPFYTRRLKTSRLL